MSSHDRPLRDPFGHRNLLDPKWVSRHRGDRSDFLARHRRQAGRAVQGGRAALKAIAPSLLHRASDERALRVALDHLEAYGGRAPGPDGLCCEDYTEQDKWALCRGLRDEIRAGLYEPDDDRVVLIPKGPGRGLRALAVQNVDDRVVQRALVEVLQPLLDPLFSGHSLGYRPGKGRLHALALAECYTAAEGRSVWVTEDVQDAFANVPLPRLLQIVKKYLPAADLVAFVGRVLSNASTPGLRQGGSLSPLLLNLYLHHFVDRRWPRRQPGIPLIRVADDILLLCRSREEAGQAHAALVELLGPAGMPVKLGFERAACGLTAAEPAHWLGFRVECRGPALAVGLADGAWDRLAECVARAREESAPSAGAVVRSWVAEMGPCYPHIDHAEAHARVRAMAGEQAPEDLPGPEQLRDYWQRAYARWRRVRYRVREAWADKQVTVPELASGAAE
jgi:RNA-directed DNA polymerase